MSREDCLLAFERFAKRVQREGESSGSVMFGMAPSGQIDVAFRVLGSFGVADEMFEAIRVLAGYKIARAERSNPTSRGLVPQEGHCLLQVPQQTSAKPSPCAKDAERYRFLRDFLDPEDFYSKSPRWTVAREAGGMGSVFRGEQLDAEIDKALASTDRTRA